MNGSSGPARYDEWIGIEEAAAYLAIPARTLYRLAQRGQVPATKVGRTWRFKRTILDQHLGSASLAHATSPAADELTRPPATQSDLRTERTDLADLSAELAALLDAGAIVEAVTRRTRAIFGVDVAVVLDVVQAGGSTWLAPCATDGAIALPGDLRIPIAGSPILREVIEGRRPAVLDDLPEEMAYGDAIVSTFGIRSCVLAPLQGDQGTRGVLVVGMLSARRFTPLEVDRLVAVAGQTGTALANARLLATSRRWSEHLEAIETLSRQLSRSRDVQGVGDTVAREIADVIDYDGLRFYVLQPDGETLEAIRLRARVDYYADETPDLVRLRLGEGLGGAIADSRRAEYIPDVLADPRGADIAGTDDVDESMIVVPMVFEDRILGVIELLRLGKDAFDPTDVRLMQILAAQAAVALVNAAQVEELERRSERLARQLENQRQLLVITERLLKTREPRATFDAIAETLQTVVPFDTLTIYLVDREKGVLVPVLARDQYAAQILEARLPIGAGITGWVVARGEAELVNDANRDPRVVVVPGTPNDEQESIIVAPLHSPGGVIGALNLYRIRRDFEPEELDLVKLYANHAALALENAQVHEQLLAAARTDPLTGLLHHGSFQDALAQTIEAGPAAVLMIDLDDFRSYNNQFGHQAGNRLLQRIAERLVSSVRAGDIVCRYGGDEFAMVLPGTDEVGARTVAEKVLAAFAELRSGGPEVHVGASIGTAAYPHDASDARDLVSIADTALFVAKHFGKGRAVAAADLPTQVREMRDTLEEVVRAAAQDRAADPGRPVDLIALVRPLHELLLAQAPRLAAANARVAELCRRAGPRFGLRDEALVALEAAALITDIGRLAADDGREATSGSIAFAHPVIAASMLEPFRELDAVTEVVRHHHERWDGSGYPDGIRGETMSPAVRLYVAVDRYCGLVAPWDGREAVSPAAAVEQLRREAGTLLPPDAVGALVAELAVEIAA
jgi:diguanylate cyclase (GGDEF)-like protein/excisionase family DNA binding protein